MEILKMVTFIFMCKEILHALNPSAARFIVTLGILLLGCQREATAQKQIEEAEQTWLGYFNQTRFTARSGVWLDMHIRFTNHYIKEKTFEITRLAYIYYITDNVRLMAGYTYANRYNRSGVNRVPEHRPWQQIFWTEKRKGFSITQTFRVEQRFRRNVADSVLSRGYNFNWRFRYNFAMTIPLKGREVAPGSPFIYLADEIHINAGKNIIYNYFDQNRLFVGLGYQFTRSLNAHLGHLFIFQHQGIPGHYLHIHAIRLYVIHSLDLRKNP